MSLKSIFIVYKNDEFECIAKNKVEAEKIKAAIEENWPDKYFIKIKEDYVIDYDTYSYVLEKLLDFERSQ
jgi:hypothetical protein